MAFNHKREKKRKVKQAIKRGHIRISAIKRAVRKVKERSEK